MPRWVNRPATEPEPPSRTLSAPRILLAGLLCFALWLFFDARQLYQSAATAPIGVRRSVAMAVLRPIARAEDAVELDRVVDAGNRLIGKTGSPGGSAIGLTAPPPPTLTTPTSAPPTGGRRGVTKVKTKPTKPTKPTGPPPLAQPTAAKPLTILDIGDSIGEDLGIGLADVIGGAPEVHLIQASVGDTGLANIGYYDWLAELPTLIAKDHPKVVVVMLGGNDAQAFQAGNNVVQFGTSTWHRIYAARVAQLIAEATSSGARVVWVGLPIMGPTSGLPNADIAEENAVFQAEAAANPAALYVASWKLFENAAGQYATYLPVNGSLVQVRDPDEVHIDPPGGTDLLATAVVHAIEAAWRIKL